MASPRLETFCCPNRDAATEFVVTFQPVLFGALSLGSAALSLLFAVLQLLPKRKGYRRLGQYPLPRPASSSRIQFIISVCDILGCAGIIVRSSVWLGLPNITEQISVANSTDVWPEVFCVGSASFVSDLCAADVDPVVFQRLFLVDLLLRRRRLPGGENICRNQHHYPLPHDHMGSGCAVVCGGSGHALLPIHLRVRLLIVSFRYSISMFVLSGDKLSTKFLCVSSYRESCEPGLQHAIPHYVTTYAPMLLVLVANPVFFNRTVSAVTSLLKGRQGIYTENERRLGNEIKIRFFKIMLVFVICWAPNIINESLLFYLEMQTDINDSGFRNIKNAALITWFIMGILNPMQALLNTLAFHGWTGFNVDLRLRRRRELVWDSASTSAPAAGGGHNPIVGTTLLYQSHIQEAKKNMMGNGQRQSDDISILSEGSESSTVEIHISSELQDCEDVDADGESTENSVRQ
ncbi:G-protein coupled receptor 143 [Collichthys lucidus]|uniref:G-protein coupled receptor 143 n=1 Tax=Collichthys lucidus TaxID=240159 RepID=A0A4U5TZJ9_COLLU|nr:G-protein coupled receptor 143 [Collichthys lucidus]